MGRRAHGARHARSVAPKSRNRWGLLAGVAIMLLTASAVGVWQATAHDHGVRNATTHAASSADPGACPHLVRAVTAASFAPVLRRVARVLGSGADCIDVEVTIADGEHATTIVVSTHADVWIPDDASWRNLPNLAAFAPGGGSTIATSPLYFVASTATAATLPATARTWTGLAGLLGAQGSVHLVVRDPTAYGDGMVAGGALTDAVIESSGPLISALDLMRAWQAGTTVHGVALPTEPGDIGIVPEYALLQSGRAGNYTVIAPTDATAVLRFTWFPTAAGMSDPEQRAALSHLHAALVSKSGVAATHADDLRAGNWPAPAPAAAGNVHLPGATAPPMEVTVQHAMWHVLTTWNPSQRVANVLVVVDVSGSMGNIAPGTHTPLIGLVRQGVAQVNSLLPNDARIGLWQFGSELAAPNDYQQLVPVAPLSTAQRAKLSSATAALAARPTGTGLYDTILAAYKYQQAHYRTGIPNEVMLFTDGVNEDDPNSISLAQVKAALAATPPSKRVQLGIFAFGKQLPTDALTDALTPVGGQVDPLTSSNEVIAAFVHAVSGGLTH